MRSYSETNLFSPDELALLVVVKEQVLKIPTRRESKVRCHELARAVGQLHGLEVADGSYGFVDHSWLWTKFLPKELSKVSFGLGFPNILDVYSVGQLPMVRLVSCSHPQLPHIGWAYRPGPARTDIDEGLVARLVKDMKR